MLVSCPSCSTRYVVDPASIGASGRRVKCVRCGEVWHQALPDEGVERVRSNAPLFDDDAPAAEPEPWNGGAADGADFIEQLARQADERDDVDAVAAALERSRQHRAGLPATAGPRKRGPGAAVLALLILLIGGLAAVGYVARTQIVGLWPPALKLYDTLGLPVDLEATGLLDALSAGLDIADVEVEWIEEIGSQVLWVRGRISNESDVSRRVPPLRIELRDDEGRPVADWVFTADRDRLPPGHSTLFETSGAVPDSRPTVMQITLAPPR